MNHAQIDILGDDYDLDRLRGLVKADREGRCVVLPCKVGDKVFLDRESAEAALKGDEVNHG